eukprot:7067414-Pyramimonas_sp.AAC.1
MEEEEEEGDEEEQEEEKEEEDDYDSNNIEGTDYDSNNMNAHSRSLTHSDSKEKIILRRSNVFENVIEDNYYGDAYYYFE